MVTTETATVQSSRQPSRSVSIPSSTYRIQLCADFRLSEVRDLIDYFDALGAGAVYSSPLFRARRGSAHGYDVIDHSRIHPEFGSESTFQEIAEQLSSRGMGLILDIVPNHMGIADSHNRYWHDLLENGPSSPHAKWFDVDWNPPKQDFEHKVILPFLGDQYGRILENQELKVVHDRNGFHLRYYEWKFPLAPRSWRYILQLALDLGVDQLEQDNPYRAELESIITSLDHLPLRTETNPERLEVRNREKGVVCRRLAALIDACPVVAHTVAEAVRRFNGEPGVPESFDPLENLLADQAYRLCYWRVAMDEINYRRFFDINELAAVRVEEPSVFLEIHQMTLEFLSKGWISGLRIDHVDGLLDPEEYLQRLQRASARALAGEAIDLETIHSIDEEMYAPENQEEEPPLSTYVLVEKILGPDERLRPTWPVHGTTGYEFMNDLNGLFVDRTHALKMKQIYRSFTMRDDRFNDIIYESKKVILRDSMSSELHVLARRLDRISEQHRYFRDFTLTSLQLALSEVIACFPVYRTYLRPSTGEVGEIDRRCIQRAITTAKRRNPALSETIFDFIRGVLLLETPSGLNVFQQAERHDFVMRFQQLTGPVMAKGLEDTAFYRCYPLASLNEVGGHPWHFGTATDHFHHENAARSKHWPSSMLSTSTHDTKRGEDTRARINVLSEIPEQWEKQLLAWHGMNASLRTELDDIGQIPDENEEYLLYQTLIGTLPLLPPDEVEEATYIDRMVQYMEKALKEAKIHTSWLDQNAEHDQAVEKFVRGCLQRQGENDFVTQLRQFVEPLIDAGLCNSLAQLVLKISSPGVPDFYQGTEFWQFTLVDPDNRRPIDFNKRREFLQECEQCVEVPKFVSELVEQRRDGRIKCFLTWKGLQARRRDPDLFLHGSYQPVHAEGPYQEHVVAFLRNYQQRWLLCVVPKLTLSLPTKGQWPLGEQAWEETVLQLPPDIPNAWHNTFTQRSSLTSMQDSGSTLSLAELFAELPVAMLTGVAEPNA